MKEFSDQEMQNLVEAAKKFPPIPEETIQRILKDAEEARVRHRHRPDRIKGRKSKPKYEVVCNFCRKKKILKVKDAKKDVDDFLEYWCCQSCFIRYWAREDLYQDWIAGVVKDEEWPEMYRIRVDRAHLKLLSR